LVGTKVYPVLGTADAFFVQKSIEADNIVSYVDVLTEFYETHKESEMLNLPPAPGELVATIFEDGFWYRGVVEDIQNSVVEILFVGECHGQAYDVKK
jgi:hypothetical protein